VQKR
jgi:hypothetical protein